MKAAFIMIEKVFTSQSMIDIMKISRETVQCRK